MNTATITTLPTFEKNSFARWVADATERYFENPDVQKRFEKWKSEKAVQDSKKVKNEQ